MNKIIALFFLLALASGKIKGQSQPFVDLRISHPQGLVLGGGILKSHHHCAEISFSYPILGNRLENLGFRNSASFEAGYFYCWKWEKLFFGAGFQTIYFTDAWISKPEKESSLPKKYSSKEIAFMFPSIEGKVKISKKIYLLIGVSVGVAWPFKGSALGKLEPAVDAGGGLRYFLGGEH